METAPPLGGVVTDLGYDGIGHLPVDVSVAIATGIAFFQVLSTRLAGLGGWDKLF